MRCVVCVVLTARLRSRCLEHFDPLALLHLLPHDSSTVVRCTSQQRAELGMSPLHLPNRPVVSCNACEECLRLEGYVEDADGAVGRSSGETLTVVVQLSVVLNRAMRMRASREQRCQRLIRWLTAG